MWLILQQKKPDDFVISTGNNKSVRQFIEIAFKFVGINVSWKGKGLKEIGIDNETKKVLVKVDKNYFRPNEIHQLLGDCSKAKRILGWKPEISFNEMVREMVSSDIEEIKNLRKKS